MEANFINNTARSGDAISGWYALVSGGAIHALDDCIINFFGNILFVNNTAFEYGGAIHIVNKVITNFLNTSNVNFTCNSAREGGAVYLEKSSRLVFESEAIFVNNEARHTGGSVSANSQLSITFLSILKITDSRVDWTGGGIALTDANMVSKNASIFMEDNEAGIFGGAVYAGKSNMREGGREGGGREGGRENASYDEIINNRSLPPSSPPFPLPSLSSLRGAVISDWLGRKPTIMAGSAVFTIGGAVQGATFHLWYVSKDSVFPPTRNLHFAPNLCLIERSMHNRMCVLQ